MIGKEFREELEKRADCKKPDFRGDCKNCKFVISDGNKKYCLIKQCEDIKTRWKNERN